MFVPVGSNNPRPPDNMSDVISRYTRAQALDDGMLCDVTREAREAGFRWPVAITSNVYERCVRVPEGMEGQDPTGRLWDILTVLRYAIKGSGGGSLVSFTVAVRTASGMCDMKLWSVVGPGDQGEPVITIMFPSDY